MANPAWLHQALHGTLACYVATGFAVAGVHALALLRGEPPEHERRALGLSLAVAAVSLPLMLLSGDLAARIVAHTQPAKFAAMEGIFETTRGASLHLGGWPDVRRGEMRYSIAVPGALSFLGFGDREAVVLGLHEFPPDRRPDPRPVHVSFQVMVGAFFLMLLPLLWAGWRWWRARPAALPRRALWLLVLSAPMGLVALEAGWLVTEFGRQPWLATGYMRLAEGVTPREGIAWIFLAFLGVYIALTAGLVRLLVTPVRPRTSGPTGQVAFHG
jgi:cytochrome d ubiquinol oxidase subunit I